MPEGTILEAMGWISRTDQSGPWPRLLALMFVLECFALVLEPIYPEIFAGGKTMDYPLWYAVGRRMLLNQDTYVVFHDEGGLGFDFLYPPFAALLLAVPAYFGKAVTVTVLAFVTLASWIASIALATRFAADADDLPPFTIAVPVGVTLPFVYDQFHLGQPNLLLLALMLGGLLLLRRDREIWAGALFALATAIKVYPVVILPYLLWRRRWRAVAGLLVFLVALLVVVPGAIRGFHRNAAELNQWVQGMLLSGSDRQFSLRSYAYGWKNQSIYAVEHRLLRPIDAEADSDAPTDPIVINVLDLSRRGADVVFVVTCVLIGLGFVALMPPGDRRTPRSDAAEGCMLLLLVVLATPVARIYYFVWTLPAYIVLTRWAAREPSRALAGLTFGAMALSLLLYLIGANDITPRWPQALGNAMWATFILMVPLGVYMRRDLGAGTAADAQPRPGAGLRRVGV